MGKTKNQPSVTTPIGGHKSMRILLVEDTQIQIDAASEQLKGHELTIVTGFDQARKELGLGFFNGAHTTYKYEDQPLPFDVLLTDVMLPKGGDECMGQVGAELARSQGPMPYGPIIALHAIQRGIKRVGILSLGNHHRDPFVFALDSLEGFQAGDIKVVCSNDFVAHYEDDENFTPIKDWTKLLRQVTAD
jgi:CheY-like chemotaxis protein